ncbi:MAG: MaoC family dehydratase [Rhodospirillales bacterium]|nr:MaoC family dehydratase [Rhodospirillales bacterium]
MTTHDLYLDDMTVGQRFESRGYTFTESDIIDFALRFDPQPFHIDVEAAKATQYGGLIASGFHTLAIAFRVLYQTGFLIGGNLGAPGIDELRWVRPVRPGDTLRTVAEVKEIIPSTSKPDRGILKLGVQAVNQRSEAAMTATFVIMVKRRRG